MGKPAATPAGRDSCGDDIAVNDFIFLSSHAHFSFFFQVTFIFSRGNGAELLHEPGLYGSLATLSNSPLINWTNILYSGFCTDV